MFYGVHSSYLNRKVEFLQLTRELESSRHCESGIYDYAFSFKNLDLEIESYHGIDLDV